jgi:ABC-type antimicrobial peptide transport system permease subunit
MYISLNQSGFSAPFFWPQHLVVRTKGDPLALSTTVRGAVRDVDPNEPVSNIRSMEQVLDAELLNRNTQMTLVAAFAVLAFLMASIGLYGVLSYTVAQRTSEIGLRMALGAQKSTVILEVVRGAALMAATGIGLGLACAFALSRLLTSWLFGVSAADPATFAATALLLGMMALLASYVPARRSASVDPVSVLRSE